MNPQEGKNAAIQALVRRLDERFGPDAFLVEGSSSPGSICFTTFSDRVVSLSIVTDGQQEGRYSVMVEVPRPPGEEDCLIPFDIAVDRSNVGLDELLEVFARFRATGMSESEWLSSNYPHPMLKLVVSGRKVSTRKLRLFGCACCRRIWHVFTDERTRHAVEAAERYADGQGTDRELGAAVKGAREAAAVKVGFLNSVLRTSAYRSRWSRVYTAIAAFLAAEGSTDCVNYAADAAATDRASKTKVQRVGKKPPADMQSWNLEEWAAQAALVRDIFGPLLFRPLPPLPPSARTWNDGLIVKLVTSIYEQRKLPEGTLDRDRLAVLADALEEAGVTDQDVLEHLRLQGAVHVRGCYILDWLTGRS